MTWDLPLWRSLLPIGRYEPTGGYRRYSFTSADSACRDWFVKAASERNLRVECDRNGNLWAWLDDSTGPDRTGAIVTGSHLDSVPDGGAFDGPLGVVSAFAAIDYLSERGFRPVRPVGVVAFVEEEGARFGVACLGSRLLAGVISPDAARGLVDSEGVSFAEAFAGAGLDPEGIGADVGLRARVGAFVELHVEQGRVLDGLGASVGVGESIWPHGRWRVEFGGRADHAGTTRLRDRRDPMLPFAATVLAAREAASELGALATIGKVSAVPGGANGICSAVRAWLDARAPDEQTLDALVARVMETARGNADSHGVTVTSRRESFTPVVEFDLDLRGRVVAALARQGMTAPVLPTGAGHDAGVLAGVVPTAMLFVRNRTGVSHSPAEYAEPGDCEAGVAALAAVLEDLACR
jgi:beta-ureidopropionase / N-carbamoyl-L-amino-acid hydrolase